MKADVDCLPEPQLRFRTSHLTGRGYGKRSGHVIRVPEDVGGVHNALQQVTGYGDTVLINQTYSEVTGPIQPPDSRPWTIDDSTPRMTPGPRSRAATATSARATQSARVAQSARKCAGEPSYVLITTTGTLPEITTPDLGMDPLLSLAKLKRVANPVPFVSTLKIDGIFVVVPYKVVPDNASVHCGFWR